MSACLDKIHLSNVDYERSRFYHEMKIYNNNLQHINVLKASQRMDQIILNWYKYNKNKNN